MATRSFLITGAAGFIGFHVARRLLKEGHTVVGLDGMTTYYDVGLKRDRLAILAAMPGFTHHKMMLEERERITRLVADTAPAIVIHLAAQAGVRYSLENPRAYIDSNVVGTFNLLEACRQNPPQHLLIASTSSVYGDGKTVPYSETSESSQPLSLYAATKKAAEVIAHSYAHLHHLPTTVFRFFTVYGPWGRPDMALFLFTAAILEGHEIEVFGHGDMSRDFTYIDDLVTGVTGLALLPPPAPDDGLQGKLSASPVAPFRIVNIGASRPVGLNQFIDALEEALGKKARRRYVAMKPGDVRRTYAETDALRALVDMPPPTPVDVGVKTFVRWYREHYGIA
jgi:UDP-glucuronate 4-epimerase